MRLGLRLLAVSVCLLFPLTVFAMKHGEMAHDSMKMSGEEIPLGEAEVAGVKATATLLDVRAAMAGHGMKTTHHLMVRFVDAASGAAIAKGRAAVKVKDAAGQESKALKMMAMAEAFGTDLTLDQPGTYQFEVGTKLRDGEKRSFSFSYNN